MGTPLCIVDIVTKSQNIFMEFVAILKSDLHADSIRLSAKINDIMEFFCIFIDVLDKADNAVRFVILDMLDFFFSSVLINDGQFGIQIGRLMHTALDLVLFEIGLFKNLGIRQEIDLCPGLLVLPMVGSRPFSSAITGCPCSYLS